MRLNTQSRNKPAMTGGSRAGAATGPGAALAGSHRTSEKSGGARPLKPWFLTALAATGLGLFDWAVFTTKDIGPGGAAPSLDCGDLSPLSPAGLVKRRASPNVIRAIGTESGDSGWPPSSKRDQASRPSNPPVISSPPPQPDLIATAEFSAPSGSGFEEKRQRFLRNAERLRKGRSAPARQTVTADSPGAALTAFHQSVMVEAAAVRTERGADAEAKTPAAHEAGSSGFTHGEELFRTRRGWAAFDDVQRAAFGAAQLSE